MEGGQKEAEYASKEADSVSFGIFGLFLEVARDISSVFQEVIQKVDIKNDSAINETLSWRPTSPDMFESEEEEEEIKKPVKKLPPAPDSGSTFPLSQVSLFFVGCMFRVMCTRHPGSKSPLSHLPAIKRAGDKNSKTNGKRKKKGKRKATVEVLIDFFYNSRKTTVEVLIGFFYNSFQSSS